MAAKSKVAPATSKPRSRRKSKSVSESKAIQLTPAMIEIYAREQA